MHRDKEHAKRKQGTHVRGTKRMGQKKEVRPRKQKGGGTGTGKEDTPEQREDRGIRAGTTNNR